jgi:hypothetical protein
VIAAPVTFLERLALHTTHDELPQDLASLREVAAEEPADIRHARPQVSRDPLGIQ